VALVAVALVAAGCGSSSKSKAGSSARSAAEARSAATGDIPDNQSFLTFKDRKDGFSISYPEGWTQSAGPGGVAFRDKDNSVRVQIARGPAPTVSSVAAKVKGAKAPPKAFTAKTNQTIKVTYTRPGTPNPVTGKTPTLTVDHYELARGGKVATVELASPIGVDNVDAYRMMIESFKWL
jgi:hypothetical protein